jgi:hypothetical protein
MEPGGLSMHTGKALTLIFTIVFGCMVFIQCSTDEGTTLPDASDINREERGVGCDPDNRAPCPEDWFICENDDNGNKVCEGQEPAVPDGGDWVCEEDRAANMIECHGTPDGSIPDDGGWVCSEPDEDGEVVCRRHSYFPDGGGSGYWDCYYQGEFRICTFHEQAGGDGDADSDSDGDGDGDSDGGIPDDGGFRCPPGIEVPTDEICGDGVDNNCDGRVDEDCFSGEDGCVCTPNAWRYCDTPDYCLWGKQVCDEDGMAWGPCLETTDIPAACAAISEWYSPAAQACCVAQGRCCQDMWDLNFNGDTWESLPDGCPQIECVDVET